MFRKMKRNKQRMFWLAIVIINVLVLYGTLLAEVQTQQLLWLRGHMQEDIKGNGTSDGYRLGRHVKEQCNKNGYYYDHSQVRMSHIYATKSGDMQFCPIWKVGTTFLKRLFMIENLNEYNNLTNPYSISFSVNYDGNRKEISNMDSSKKVMFVRNPYQRLLSCYVDKLLAPNPVYWRLIGIPAIKHVRKEFSKKSETCGHDLTFSEFIKYVISAMETPSRGFLGKSRRNLGLSRDPHFEQQTVICKPCHLKYDFVGKMESFKEDSLELVRQMNLSAVAEFLKENGSSLAAEDAINDTTSQPVFGGFKKKYLSCISEKEALQRAWQKLQIRGLIGNKSLEITDTEAKVLTFEQFQHMAMEARNKSSKEERNAVKRHFYYRMYETVPLEDLERISRIYQDDFDLFEYDSRPSDLFSKRT